MESNRWPIDYENLKKGDIIPAERLEQIVNHSRNSRRYDLAIMSLAKRIESEMALRRRPVTVKSEKGSLKILTDAEASPHNHRSLRTGIRRAFRCHLRNMAVDTTNLNEDQKKDHERFIEVDGRVIQAITDAKKMPTLRAATRQVPGLCS